MSDEKIIGEIEVTRLNSESPNYQELIEKNSGQTSRYSLKLNLKNENINLKEVNLNIF